MWSLVTLLFCWCIQCIFWCWMKLWYVAKCVSLCALAAEADWICDACCVIRSGVYSDDFFKYGVGTDWVWERNDAEQWLFIWRKLRLLAAAVPRSDRRHAGTDKHRSSSARTQEQCPHRGHDGRGDQTKRSSTTTQQTGSCSLSTASSRHHQPTARCMYNSLHIPV